MIELKSSRCKSIYDLYKKSSNRFVVITESGCFFSLDSLMCDAALWLIGFNNLYIMHSLLNLLL